MSHDPILTLEALEKEEARLLERLSKIAAAKEMLIEFGAPGPASVPRAIPSVAPYTKPGVNAPAAPVLGQLILGPSQFEFDGTFTGLVRLYRSHPDSPYHGLKHKVRVGYDNTLGRIVNDVGFERVADWNAQRVKAVYDGNWAAGGKIAMGHSLIAKLRLLCTFGSTVLNDDGCTRLSAILGNLRFPVSKGSGERLTREQARAVRVTARGLGWDSISLAQALQFELPKLRQADVIGEWVPLSEPGTSDIVRGEEKWLRGLRWSDIDENMVLRATLTSGRANQQREVEFRLSRSQMIMEELNRVPQEKRKGPLVICEFTGLPWTGNEFRRKWRIVADKAGLPASVRNGGGVAKSDLADESTKGIFG
jgi:hypothetical protein